MKEPQDISEFPDYASFGYRIRRLMAGRVSGAAKKHH